MNRSGMLAIIVCLIGLNLFLLLKVVKKNSVVSTVDSAVQSETESAHNHDNYTNLLRGRIQLQVRYDQVSIRPDAIVMDTLGKNMRLKNVISSEENLVFFFTNNHCYSCIDSAIPHLEKLAGKIGYDKIFLLANLNERRDILAFKEKYNSKLRIYSITDEAITSKAKDLNYPFSFLITKEVRTHSLFFIERDLPQVTDDYMKEVERYFATL